MSLSNKLKIPYGRQDVNQEDIDKVDEITQFFPFRLTKHSKYVVGIDRLRNW